jgi:RNA polymerase sigma-54 factor
MLHATGYCSRVQSGTFVAVARVFFVPGIGEEAVVELAQSPEVKQKVTLSPQVYQGLTILSMPITELQAIIDKELLENPVLESDEFDEGDDLDDAESEESAEEQSADEEQDAWDEWLDQYEDLSESEPVVPRDPNVEEVNTEDFVGGVTTFTDYLNDQLSMLEIAEEVEHAALAIIGSLDQDGFFVGDLTEIAAIAAVQQLDPPGVGARSAQEALLLQVEVLELEDPHLVPIIESHLEDVAANRFRKIARALGTKEAQVRETVELMRVLNPRPAGAFSPGISPAYVVPDVTLRRFDEDWLVIPNSDALPVLRVSPRYRSILRRDGSADAETVRYLKEKIRGAETFIRNVERRKDTVSRIAEIILETQADFFEDGKGDLRPLRLEDVAVELGVHLSTVSRGVTGKYMATPYGLYELKYFFAGGYRTSDGMDVASTTVKKRLGELVQEEDAKSPMSDQALADALAEQGVTVARRTVAKYREELGIDPSWARRRR